VVSNSDIVPEIGITGTPVIDGSTNTLYVVAATLEARSGVLHYVQKLHALDITTGTERTAAYTLGDTVQGGPEGGWTNVSAISVNGVGDGASGGVLRFNAARENNRAALQLVNGVVYVAFASHSDFRPYTGWLLGFNPQTLQPVKVFNTSPNSGGNGLWQSGGPVSADAQGNLYFALGNGFSGPQGQAAYNPALGNWSESVLKLSATGALTVSDYFTPHEWQTLDSRDADLGSGGVMLLPDSVGSVAHPHLMVETGKSGKLYLIDRDMMGHLNNPGPDPTGGPDLVVQTVTAGQTGVWGNPTFFQVNPTTGIIYYHGSGDVLKGYRITNGHIDDTPANILRSPAGTLSNFPGTQPVISANGIANPTNPTDGIVWELQVDNFGGGTPSGNRPLTGPAILRALKATDLNTVLYDSSSSAVGQRDLFGDPIKFTAPTVTNGHVLVGQALTFSVFGLFPQATATPAARSNLAGVVQAGIQGPEVHLSWTNPAPGAGADPTGTKISRSTDGTNFTLLTTVFRLNTTFTDTGPFSYGQHYFYRVAATNQLGDSPLSDPINVLVPIPPATLTLTGTGTSSVGLSWNGVANNHYDVERSTDGTTFTRINSAPLPAFQTTYTDTGLAPGQYAYRIHAFNVSPDADSLSNVQAAWVGPMIDHSAPSFAGFANATDLTVNGSAFVSPTEHVIRLTNANGQTGSVFSDTRFTVGNFTTRFDVRLHEGTQPNYADGFTFVLQPNAPTALGSGTAGIGYQGIGHSVAVVFSTFQHTGDPSSSWVGLALNGAAPATRVDTTSSGLLLNSQDIKQIDLSYAGTNLMVRVQDVIQPQLVFTTSIPVNLAQVLGSDTAYVGFTGASGSSNYWQLEDVVDWKFTSQAPVPGAPTNLRETAFTSSAIDLAWNSNSYNQTGYQVERSTDGTNFAPLATTTATSYQDREVIPTIAYFYRVRALGAQGNSPYSNTLRASLPSPVLNQEQDIGTPGTPGDPSVPGSATFVNGTYTLTASGSDIWGTADHFHYVYQPFLGDGEIVARVVSVGRADFYTKAGVMFRETLAANAKKAFVLEFPPPDHNQPAFNWRGQTGGASSEVAGPGGLAAPIWVRLVRSGNDFSAYYALDAGGGTHGPWIQVATTQTILMAPNVYVGLALTAHANGSTSTSVFDNVQVLPAVPRTSHLDVSVARGATNPGTPVSITVTALDAYNNTVTGYLGTVHFTSSDPQAVLPPDYTFTATDNGRHTFAVQLGGLGRQALTVTDAATPALAGGTVVTVLSDPVVTSLLVTGLPTRIGAGVAGSFTVTARDGTGNTLSGYRGTVHFVSSDPLAQLPADYTFTATDAGTHTFSATLNTPGMQSVTATDPTVRIVGTQSSILVIPAAPVVTGATVTPAEGKAFGVAPRFDGADDYIQVPSTLVVGGAITIEAWVKSTNVVAPWARVIDFSNGPNLDNIIFGWMGNSGHLYFETYRNGQTIMLVTPMVFPQNQWVHVAAVNDGNGMGFIYINGVLVASGAQMIPATVTRTEQWVARSAYAADAFFPGSIEELHIWNTVRSGAQVQMDMNQLTGAAPGLVLYYPLDEGSGNTAFDRTAGHYNGTLTSTMAGDQPAWVADAGPGPGRVVATFTSADSSATASSFTAQITWGDGHQSAGTIAPNGLGGYSVSGSNTYAEEGSYPVRVTVTDAFGSMGMAQGTANVADVAVAVTGGRTFTSLAGVLSSAQTVATFTDPSPEALGDYSATIDWGDNTAPSAGTISGPSGGTFTVQGSHNYLQAGSYTITVTVHHDTAPDATATSTAQVTAPVVHFMVAGFPSPTVAGTPGSFMVTALDQFNETITGYRGTVHFTSSDLQAQLPPDYTFVAADNGTQSFTATLKTAGSQSLTATDTATVTFTGTQSGIVVNPGPTVALVFMDVPESPTAGLPFGFDLTAQDAFGNATPAYRGTVHFTSSDPLALLPANYTFTARDAGSHDFGAVLRQAGAQSITATDTATASITGTQEDILVVAADASSLVVTASPATTTAGDTITLTVTVRDAFGNVATGYRGIVSFSSSDGQAALPAEYTFTADDAGAHAFTVVLGTAGDQTVTVAQADGTLADTANVHVVPGAATHLRVTVPDTVTAGSFFQLVITALDAYGNVATGEGGPEATYTGTVSFLSTDPTAQFVDQTGQPVTSYTFSSADQGQAIFFVSLNQPGEQGLILIDTKNHFTNTVYLTVTDDGTGG
jgi:hypothetical protein